MCWMHAFASFRVFPLAQMALDNTIYNMFNLNSRHCFSLHFRLSPCLPTIRTFTSKNSLPCEWDFRYSNLLLMYNLVTLVLWMRTTVSFISCTMSPILLWIYMAVPPQSTLWRVHFDMNAWMRSMLVLRFSYFIGACSYIFLEFLQLKLNSTKGSSCCVNVSVEDPSIEIMIRLKT